MMASTAAASHSIVLSHNLVAMPAIAKPRQDNLPS